MKTLLSYIPGLLAIGFSGYLCLQENPFWGWFLAIGFFLSLCSLGSKEG